MFKALGAIVAIYVAYAVLTGGVYAKSGIRMVEVLRDERPGYFWSVVFIYAILSLALIFIF